jgi:leader peptidase (prepilin peptidase)/N-methyltransferase
LIAGVKPSDIVGTIVPMLMPFTLAAVGGAAIGYVLTSCIYNLPRRRPLMSPVPRGSRHAVISVLAATLCAGALWLYGPTLLFASRVVLGCALIVLFAIDAEHRLLPNLITVPGIAIGFLFSFVTEPGWWSSLIGIVFGGGLPLAVAELYYRVRAKEGLGMGDVKMLAMIGAFLGWPAAMLTLMLGSIAGSIVGLLVIALRRGDLQYTMPFGTFLAVGAAVSAVLGQPLFEWLARIA